MTELSGDERWVLTQVANGTPACKAHLYSSYLTPWECRQCVDRARVKLDAMNTTHAVAVALRLGMIE